MSGLLESGKKKYLNQTNTRIYKREATGENKTYENLKRIGSLLKKSLHSKP
jgi:hypothetical protein